MPWTTGKPADADFPTDVQGSTPTTGNTNTAYNHDVLHNKLSAAVKALRDQLDTAIGTGSYATLNDRLTAIQSNNVIWLDTGAAVPAGLPDGTKILRWNP